MYRSTFSFAVGLAVASASSAQVTVRVGLGSSGQQPNDHAVAITEVTPDGRYALFVSSATNLVPGDTNGQFDCFVRDRRTGTTERVNVGTSGAEANGESYPASITPDGRYVTFGSRATNLVPGDTNGSQDVFLRDRWAGTTTRVSLDSNGGQGDGSSWGGDCSDDGRYVAFASDATQLVGGDTNGWPDAFVHDRATGTTERVSVDSSGAQAVPVFMAVNSCAISADGRFVAFDNDASNLDPSDANGVPDVFVKDRQTGTTELVSVGSNGEQQDDYFYDAPGGFHISGDGRWVGFNTIAGNLVPGDTNAWFDGFVRDRLNGTTERVTVGPGGLESACGGSVDALSADGRFAVITAESGLVPGGSNHSWNVYLRDRLASTTERMSVSSSGIPGNLASSGGTISADGRYVAFASSSNNLVPGDTNQRQDIFVRDRFGGTTFTSVCDPGVGGIAVCACDNPPAGPGRGCDNSAGTGGAALRASGGTFLSSDSLVLEATRQYPGTLSLLLQGDSPLTSGTVFGQGIRCAGGALEVLYAKVSTGGRMRAPDFAAGDETISARSSARGSLIRPGERRSYFVAYRDPVVLGGCPSTSTFNSTQTGVVLWAP